MNPYRLENLQPQKGSVAEYITLLLLYYYYYYSLG